MLPSGSVYVVSARSGVKAVLSSPIGGAELLWEPSAKILWVESGDAWSSFPLADVLGTPKEKAERPAIQRANLTTKFARRKARAVSAFPLSGGRFALRTSDGGASSIEIFSAPDGDPQVIGLPNLAPSGIVKVSPNATYVLTLPEGPKSNAFVIGTL